MAFTQQVVGQHGLFIIAFLLATSLLVFESDCVAATAPATAACVLAAVTPDSVGVLSEDLQSILWESVIILCVVCLSAKFYKSKTKRSAKVAPALATPPNSPPARFTAARQPTSKSDRKPTCDAVQRSSLHNAAVGGNHHRQTVNRSYQPAGNGHMEDSTEPNLLITAVHKGLNFKIKQLLDSNYERALSHSGSCKVAEERAQQDLLQVFRTCVATRKFYVALLAFDQNASRIGAGCTRLWSLLLYCSVEARSFERCPDVIARLSTSRAEKDQLTENDVVNMLRFYAHKRDLHRAEALLADICSEGRVLSGIARNQAVRACAAEDCVEVTEAVLYNTVAFERLNQVSCNSALKSLLSRGQVACCLKLHRRMGQLGLEPTLETFGILMDVYIKDGRIDQAQEIFKQLCESGLQVNAVHLTTYIKGLLNYGRMDAALEVLRFMQSGPAATKPDIVTYQTFVKAQAEWGDIEGAMSTLDDVVREGFKPDAVMLDTLLTGSCARGLQPSVVVANFKKLIGHGFQPAHAQFALVLKALTNASAWQEAFDFLEDLRTAQPTSLENTDSVYGFLGLCCAHAKDYEMATKVCKAMLAATSGGSTLGKGEVSSAQMLESWIGVGADSDFGGLHVHNPKLRLQQFSSRNRLGQQCVQALAQLSTAQVEWVMDRKFTFEGLTETAVEEEVYNTIRRAKATCTDSYPNLWDIRKRLTNFAQLNDLDTVCTESLKKLPEDQLRWVMDQEFIVEVDPARGSASAKVVGRMGRARNAVSKGFSAMGTIAKFIEVNALDDNCASYLRSLHVLDAIWVMDQEFRVTVDPSKGTASAKVTGLINKVKSVAR